MKNFKELPFKDGFINLRPDPNNPPIDRSPCLDIDRRHPDYLSLIRDCPMRVLPGLAAGRRKPAQIAEPDLMIAAHQSVAAAADEIVHAISVKNIGTGTSTITGSGTPGNVIVQFWASMNPLLDGDLNIDYVAAGGWSLQAQDIVPDQEIDLSFQAGLDNRPPTIDYREFQYVIAQLRCGPPVDTNLDNNLSIVPMLVVI